MFNPEQFIQSNSLFSYIQEQESNSTRPYFYLATDSPYLGVGGSSSNQVFGFPYIPSQISFSYATNYNTISRSMSKTEDLQFTGNKAETVTISDVILSTRSQKKSFLPLIEQLKTLMTNQVKPVFFYICIQERILYPYVMNTLDVIETGWISGMPVEGTISFTFTRNSWGLKTVGSYDNSWFKDVKDARNPGDIGKSPSQILQDRIDIANVD